MCSFRSVPGRLLMVGSHEAIACTSGKRVGAALGSAHDGALAWSGQKCSINPLFLTRLKYKWVDGNAGSLSIYPICPRSRCACVRVHRITAPGVPGRQYHFHVKYPRPPVDGRRGTCTPIGCACAPAYTVRAGPYCRMILRLRRPVPALIHKVYGPLGSGARSRSSTPGMWFPRSIDRP